MREFVCRKSVFGILFLALFSVGAVCGILLLRCLLLEEPEWLQSYCAAVAGARPSISLLQLLLWLWPLLAVLAAGLSPCPRQLLGGLIVLRGCLLAYYAGACYVTGQRGTALLWELLQLPVFYCLCRFFMGQSPDQTHL